MFITTHRMQTEFPESRYFDVVPVYLTLQGDDFLYKWTKMLFAIIGQGMPDYAIQGLCKPGGTRIEKMI